MLNGAQPEAQQTPYNTVVSTAQHKLNSFMNVKAANNINLPSQNCSKSPSLAQVADPTHLIQSWLYNKVFQQNLIGALLKGTAAACSSVQFFHWLNRSNLLGSSSVLASPRVPVKLELIPQRRDPVDSPRQPRIKHIELTSSQGIQEDLGRQGWEEHGDRVFRHRRCKFPRLVQVSLGNRCNLENCVWQPLVHPDL